MKRQALHICAAFLIACGVLAGTVFASPPDRSLRPLPRPGGVYDLPRADALPAGYNAEVRPRPRPNSPLSLWDTPTAAAPLETPVAALPNRLHRISASASGVAVSLRPVARPANISRVIDPAEPAQTSAGPAQTRAERRAERRATRRAERQASRRRSSASRRGSVCGNRLIRGRELAAIPGRLNGCGVENPVQITEIDGVVLSQPATINCETAEALQTWINDGVRPVVGSRGGGVAGLRVIAHYSCRTRNNRAGARISEHGRGRALDIAAITLENGSEISVEDDWGRGREGRVLRRLHEAACGPFGTVLGPESDRYHHDHFHFDTASYRSGSYCR